MWNYNYLEHDGVKNQKWGLRRYQNPDGTYTPLGLARRRAEYRSQRRKALKNDTQNTRSRTKSMTNEELTNATERLKLENAYIEAREQRYSGRTFVRDTLRQIGKNAAVTVANKMAGVAADALVRQIASVTVNADNGTFASALNEAAMAARAKNNPDRNKSNN